MTSLEQYPSLIGCFNFKLQASKGKRDSKFSAYISVNLNPSMSHFNIEIHRRKMLRCFILVAMSLTLSFADNTNASKVAFILDFLKSQTIPTNLIVWRNCFDNSEHFELIKRSSISTAFNKQDSLSESDFRENPQYWLFALDLTCTSAPEKISQKVNSSMCCHCRYWLFTSSRLDSTSSLFPIRTDRRDALLASISMDNVCGERWR